LISTMIGIGVLFTVDNRAADFSRVWDYFQKMFGAFIREEIKK